ncbi:hypothetical protein GT755_36425 [Herbidospora sp. NEAU-GS84]|uniref:Uncharacterized protein n=1 Tax=Herbidospora solisilvae TaxID=2696284 RepID=A0A7C9J810_9ACTN|nr:hypothetical protein [Herbidospora solisilvae]NAS27142.1 hypothetical protein [Herbidospora solisilvae]
MTTTTTTRSRTPLRQDPTHDVNAQIDAILRELELELPSRPGKRPDLIIGTLTVPVDLTDAMRVPKGGEAEYIDAQLSRLAGKAIRAGEVLIAQAFGGDPAAVAWFMSALCLLTSNQESIRRLHGVGPAVARLRNFCVKADCRVAVADPRFPQQVVQVSGWLQAHVLSTITTLQEDHLQQLDAIYNPGRIPAKANKFTPPQIGPLKPDVLKAQLVEQLKAVVRSELSQWQTDTGAPAEARPLQDIRAVADYIQGWMRDRFPQFVLASPDSRYHTGFVYGHMIESTLSKVAGYGGQLGWLRNRGDLVGWDEDWGAPYVAANYNPNREADTQLREKLLLEMMEDKEFVPDLIKVVRLTASHAPGKVTYIQPFFKIGVSKVDFIWDQIHTLIHEFMHFLTHQNFHDAAKTIGYRQVLDEGVTEFIATVYFKLLVDHARADDRVARALLGDRPFEEPPARLFSPGYGKAGKDAFTLAKITSLRNVQAAYFLGVMPAIGLK